jgi:hypothetical protein
MKIYDGDDDDDIYRGSYGNNIINDNDDNCYGNDNIGNDSSYDVTTSGCNSEVVTITSGGGNKIVIIILTVKV